MYVIKIYGVTHLDKINFSFDNTISYESLIQLDLDYRVGKDKVYTCL